LENLGENDDDHDHNHHMDVSSVWENIEENMKVLVTESQIYYELQLHKPWLEE
jgi:hypothetical protein